MNIKTEELDTGIKLTATIPMFEEKELETFDNNIHNIAKEYCEMHLKEKEQILTQRLIKLLEDENSKQKEVLDKIKPMLEELNIKIKDILNIGIDIKEISDILELLEEIK